MRPALIAMFAAAWAGLLLSYFAVLLPRHRRPFGCGLAVLVVACAAIVVAA